MKSDAQRNSAALAGILVAGALLRLHGITRESAWIDEAITLAYLDAPSLRQFLREAFTTDPWVRMVPLYHVVEYGWSRVFGTELLAMRCLSAALGVAGIAMLFDVGRLLFGRGAGLIAAAGLAVSLPHIYYAQEVRFYALIGLLALVSMDALVRAVRSGRRRWWALQLAANAALLWSHVFTPLLFAAQGAWLLLLWVEKRHFREQNVSARTFARWAAAHAALGALFAGWLASLGYEAAAEARAYQVAPGTLRDFGNAVLVFTGGRFARENPAPCLPGGLSFDLAIGLAFLALGCLQIAQAARERGARLSASVLVWNWLLLPLVGLFLVSQAFAVVFVYRYVLYAGIAVPLIAGAALAGLESRALRGVILSLLAAAYAWQNLALPRPFRPAYDAAWARVAPNETVLILKEFNAWGLRYAAGPLAAGRIVRHEGIIGLRAEAIDAARAGNKVWVFFYRWDDVAAFAADMEAAGFRCERFTHGGMPPLESCRIIPNP